MRPLPAPSCNSPRTSLRQLAKPLVAPHVFDFWATTLNRTWTWERTLARVVGREQASRDAVTLWLQPNRHWGGFRPGQHVNVGAEIDGSRVTRSYSLTHPPRRDGRIAITVKAIEGGKLSRHLCNDLRMRDVVALGPAFGEMTLPDAIEGEWLFLAAGSGITPLMAMVRTLAAQGMPVPLTLVYWARTRDELCFADELRALAAQMPRFRVHLALTRESARHPGEQVGRLDEALLPALVDNLSTQRVFACGPDGFVQQARGVLGDRARSFQSEAFTPPAFVAGDTGSVQVVLAASRRTLQLPRGQSLLAALEAQGVKPASGCRMGICNTCACEKISGTTRQLRTGEVASEPASALKLCINGASSDLVLDL